MKTITVSFNVYSFDELSGEAQNQAIEEVVTFFMEYVPFEHLSPAMQRACNKAQQMQTPWFTASYMLEYAKDEILAFCREYDYVQDGTIYMASGEILATTQSDVCLNYPVDPVGRNRLDLQRRIIMDLPKPDESLPKEVRFRSEAVYAEITTITDRVVKVYYYYAEQIWILVGTSIRVYPLRWWPIGKRIPANLSPLYGGKY